MGIFILHGCERYGVYHPVAERIPEVGKTLG